MIPQSVVLGRSMWLSFFRPDNIPTVISSPYFNECINTVTVAVASPGGTGSVVKKQLVCSFHFGRCSWNPRELLAVASNNAILLLMQNERQYPMESKMLRYLFFLSCPWRLHFGLVPFGKLYFYTSKLWWLLKRTRCSIFLCWDIHSAGMKAEFWWCGASVVRKILFQNSPHPN